MRRKLFNVMAVASSGVFILLLALWGRSEWRFDEIGYRIASHDRSLMSCRGVVGFESVAYSQVPTRYPLGWRISLGKRVEVFQHTHFVFGNPAHWSWSRRAGFRWDRTSVFWGDDAPPRPNDFLPWAAVQEVFVPYWFLALITGLPVIWLLRGWARRWIGLSRVRHGACANCGYDLRATPDRCPECGTAAVSAK